MTPPVRKIETGTPIGRGRISGRTLRIPWMLEAGVAPWQKPWQGLQRPMNPTTDKAYRGGNAVHLMATAVQFGYNDPRWMTYKQAADNNVDSGEQILKNSGATLRHDQADRCFYNRSTDSIHLTPKKRSKIRRATTERPFMNSRTGAAILRG